LSERELDYLHEIKLHMQGPSPDPEAARAAFAAAQEEGLSAEKLYQVSKETWPEAFQPLPSREDLLPKAPAASSLAAPAIPRRLPKRAAHQPPRPPRPRNRKPRTP
jgi:hypothetical protein